MIEAKGFREHFHVQRPMPRSKQGGHEWCLQLTPTFAPVLLDPKTSSYLLSFLQPHLLGPSARDQSFVPHDPHLSSCSVCT